MDSHNSFLREFMAMRKTIIPSAITAGKPAAKEEKKKKPKIEPKQEAQEAGMAEIIEKKPHKKVVIEFMQRRANELSVQKMQ
jgi:hypothetical protein